jgi:UDP:flavonoid glycosyltransferase YjiC (YdhE family)
MTKKIVLATLGSHGDIHPFIALGKALQSRGYAPVLATTDLYRDVAEREGLAFFAVRPGQDDVLRGFGLTIEQLARKTMADDTYLIRLIQTSLAASYRDLLPLVEDADLVLTHRIAYAAKCAAEKCAIPHVDIALSPMLLFSDHDPPIGGPAPFVRNPSPLGRAWNRSLFSLIKTLARPYCRQALQFRTEIGLPANGDVPFLQDSAARAAFGLFSPLLAAAQPDFPAAAIVGSTFHDGGASAPLDNELEDFLAAGEPPLVMTLGSFAALDGAEILRGGMEAARRLHRRVVVIAGREDAKNFAHQAGPDVLVRGYAPHSTVFSRAAVVVHHGGVGTAAQALRSGRPQLIIPFFADQPDNAGRIARLGCARVLPRRQFTPRRAEAHFQALLERSDYRENAAKIADRIAMEDGAAEAARLIAEWAKL